MKGDERTFICAHGHAWEMLEGEAKRCPHCGTITFEQAMWVPPRPTEDEFASLPIPDLGDVL